MKAPKILMFKSIRKIMIDRDLNITSFAKLLGITREHLSHVLNGQVKAYPLREKIAFTLNVPYETLWRHENSNPAERQAA